MTAPTLDERPAVVGFGRSPRARRRRLLVVLSVLALAVVGGLAWLVLFSSTLAVQQVRVVGVGGVQADQVRAAAAIPTGVPLATVDTTEASAAILELGWVATVEVRRGWPSEIVLAVEARTPVARQPDGRLVVDASGTVFEPVGPVPKGLPVVKATGLGLETATAVLVSLPADLARRVDSLSATTRDNAEFTLRSGALVRWGSAEQAEFKASVLRALMKRDRDVYDVTAPELPTTFSRR